MAALVGGDHAAARAALEGASTGGGPLGEVRRELFLAAIAADEGKLDAALTAVARAEGIAEKAKLVAMHRRARLLAVALGLARAPQELDALRAWIAAARDGLAADQAAVDRAAVDRTAVNQGAVDHALLADLTLGALLAARHADVALAGATLDAVGPAVENSGYVNLEQPYAAARCELLAPDTAIDCLNTLSGAHPYYQQRVGLWLAQRRDGREQEARESARWLVKQRGRAIVEWIDGYVAQVPNLLAAADARAYLAVVDAASPVAAPRD